MKRNHDIREYWMFLVFFAAIATFLILDLVSDYSEETSAPHLVGEGSVALVALFGVGLTLRRLYLALQEIRVLGTRVTKSQQEMERWRAEAETHLRGLGEAIQTQFDVWGLTPSEAEVALLLLKGYSFKDISRLRHRAEKTVRTQAAEVYKKAAISGRAELSAFFLEDLLLPHDQR